MRVNITKANILMYGKKTVHFPAHLYRHNRPVFIAFTLVIALCFAGIGIGYAHRSDASIDKPTMEIVEKLPFDSIIPEGQTIEELGGWRQISPPGSDPVYAYSDTLDNVQIIVSEQKLPKNLRSDKDITELSEKFNATRKLKIKDATTYIGKSAKGPQSIISVKNDILVLIKSKDTIRDSVWVDYIMSLK